MPVNVLFYEVINCHYVYIKATFKVNANVFRGDYSFGDEFDSYFILNHQKGKY